MNESEPQLRSVADQKSKRIDPNLHASPRSARTGQWTADGTCIVQTTPNNTIETIVLSENLLEDDEHHELMPYSKYASSDPIYATAVYPHFSLGSPTTTLVLYAARETPIQLRNALDYAQGIYATYRWFDPNTEEVVTPHSLVFNADATHFVAGSRAKFAIFDVNRPNAKAATIRATSKSRHAVKIYGEDSHKFSTLPHSCITTIDISSEDVLAFGTTTRHVALYADHGQGDLISSFRLPVASSNGPFNGKGITQVKWSPDGTYLFIAERQSDIIEVYDIRHNHQRLSWLSGRQANVNFKLGFDVVPTLHGLEVWGGGADGYVRMWSSPEQQEGEIRWAGQWPVHDDPVCSTLVHASGSVVATLSQKDRYEDRDRLSSGSSDDSDESLSDTDTRPDEESEGEITDEPGQANVSTQSTTLSGGTTFDVNLKIWAIT